MTFLTGKTNIAGALRLLIDQSFTAAAGGRNNVPHVVVIFTDGSSNLNNLLTLQYATEAKNGGEQCVV